jgi:hypothetical protein
MEAGLSKAARGRDLLCLRIERPGSLCGWGVRRTLKEHVMLHKKRLIPALAAGLALGAVAGPAAAAGGVWDGPALNPGNGFGGRTASWIDLSAGTIHAEWNVFTDDANATFIVDNTPDVTNFGPGTKQVRENTAGAFLTSGGNIYSPSIATDFTVTLGGYLPVVTGTRVVALRTSTLGSELAYGSARLNGVAGSYYETFRENITGGFGGAEVESLWLWTVADAASYVFDFNAASSSVSMDQIAAFVGPVNAVPEPGTWALMAGGLALVGVWRMRRNSA